MAIVLEPRERTAPAGDLPASVADPAWEDDGWEISADGSEENFPWLRLMAIGVVIGFLVGLPLIPTSDTTLTNFGEIAGAYGCPFHAGPIATDTTTFTISQ